MFNGRIVLCGPAEPSELFPYAKFTLPSGHGGVPVNLLALELASRGFEVCVVSTSSEIDEPWSYREGKLSVNLIPRRVSTRETALDFFRREIRDLTQIVLELSGDIVHAHWTYEYALAAIYADRDAVVTAHDAPLTILRQFKDPYRLLRYLLALKVRNRMINLTAVSPYLATRWKKEMLWRNEITVIPNITPFLASTTRALNSDSQKIVCIANDTKRKNVKALISAWPFVKQNQPQASLHLIGDGLDAGSKLLSESKFELSVNSINFEGSKTREQIKSMLNEARVFVLPSLEESQPMVLLEAMSHGVPIVAGKDSGGVAWTLGGAGLTIDVRQPRQIAAAILSLMEDQLLSSQLGAIGKQRVQTVFSREKVTEHYIEIYNKVLSRK